MSLDVDQFSCRFSFNFERSDPLSVQSVQSVAIFSNSPILDLESSVFLDVDRFFIRFLRDFEPLGDPFLCYL